MEMDMLAHSFMPFTVAISVAISLLGVVLLLYALYDLLVVQDTMATGEKLIWLVILLLFNVLGAIVYLVVIKYLQEHPFESLLSIEAEEERLTQLERLADLKERGAITEEEFDAEKERIMNETSEK